MNDLRQWGWLLKGGRQWFSFVPPLRPVWTAQPQPWRTLFLAYVFVIVGFATTYYLLGLHDLIGPHHLPGPHFLSWYEAIVVSMTAFHGRGFFAGAFSPGDPQALVAAIEAFVGLLIEVTFIATLTQRLFSR